MNKILFESLRGENKLSEPYTLERRISILGLTKERVDILNKLLIKEIDINCDEYERKLDYIDINKLVGLNRRIDNVTTWLELLEKLHKMKNFENFDLKNFKEFILKTNEDDPPSVLEYGEEYYIDGDGKHRLTIAKCLGIEKAKVVIFYKWKLRN